MGDSHSRSQSVTQALRVNGNFEIWELKFQRLRAAIRCSVCSLAILGLSATRVAKSASEPKELNETC